ncbi:hypothetical protein PBI_SCTP2_220 [Salicola phage SCTP-2]|nr:hypothetical protein PBI_SCTP2_220 [Salicola phage SCTP-2]
MNLIETVLIEFFLEDVDKDESELKEEIENINSQYREIDNCLQFEPGRQYMCLGQDEMGDNIVLVSKSGRVFKLPYDEDYIQQ